jgi:hypothetical protein
MTTKACAKINYLSAPCGFDYLAAELLGEKAIGRNLLSRNEVKTLTFAFESYFRSDWQWRRPIAILIKTMW